MPLEAAKLIIEVVAGIIANQPMPEYTKRFGMTSAQFETEDPQAQQSAWDRVHGEALLYAYALMNPNKVNWVRLDWIWV